MKYQDNHPHKCFSIFEKQQVEREKGVIDEKMVYLSLKVLK